MRQVLQLFHGGRNLFSKVGISQQWLQCSASFSQVYQVNCHTWLNPPCQNRVPHHSHGLLQVDSSVLKVCVNHKSSKKDGKSKKAQNKIKVSDEDLESVVNVSQMRSEMEAVLEKLQKDYMVHLKVRTDIGSFENIMVSIDGQDVPLNQVAQIMQKGPMMQINLGASPQYIQSVKKSLEKSGLNINPQLEGNSIFLPVPKVTREHREKMAKLAKDLFNKAKDDIGQSHTKYYKQVKGAKNNIREDLFRDIQTTLVTMSHQYRDKAEEMMKRKQEEVLKG